MPAFLIFVEGADTEPAKVPVYAVESEEHASLICEGMKESEYGIFNFSFHQGTRSDRGKFAVWATMIDDARKGVYGNIVAGIYEMIDGAYWIMSGRRLGDKIASGADTKGKGLPSAKPLAPGDTKARKAKADTPTTKRNNLREQRLAFCRPRRAKGETWERIYAAYHGRFPKDEKASPATLRLSLSRNKGKGTTDS